MRVKLSLVNIKYSKSNWWTTYKTSIKDKGQNSKNHCYYTIRFTGRKYVNCNIKNIKPGEEE